MTNRKQFAFRIAIGFVAAGLYLAVTSFTVEGFPMLRDAMIGVVCMVAALVVLRLGEYA